VVTSSSRSVATSRVNACNCVSSASPRCRCSCNSSARALRDLVAVTARRRQRAAHRGRFGARFSELPLEQRDPRQRLLTFAGHAAARRARRRDLGIGLAPDRLPQAPPRLAAAQRLLQGCDLGTRARRVGTGPRSSLLRGLHALRQLRKPAGLRRCGCIQFFDQRLRGAQVVLKTLVAMPERLAFFTRHGDLGFRRCEPGGCRGRCRFGNRGALATVGHGRVAL
jgi:hypothetical protein